MKQARFHVYKAKDGWRWRLIASNGRIIADSGEAYTRKGSADAAVERTIKVAELMAHHRRMERMQRQAATVKRPQDVNPSDRCNWNG